MSLTERAVTVLLVGLVLVSVWLLLVRLKADVFGRWTRDYSGLLLAGLGAAFAGGLCAVAADHTVPGLHDTWCGFARTAAEEFAKFMIGLGTLLGAASGACWDRYLRLHHRPLVPWLSQQLIRLALAAAVALVIGLGLLVYQPKAYWVARCFGEKADLSGAVLSCKWLRAASLMDASLRGTDFSGTDLTRAQLLGADLRHARLTNANLTGSNLATANLGGASLRGAVLVGANLYRAKIDGTDFRGADLRLAKITISCLCECDLRGADLRGADLHEIFEIRGVKLQGAIYDRHTRWRSGFNPLKAGAVKIE
jgi:hypothetical protein